MDVTVTHEPGCISLVLFGILLALLWKGGCTINIGSSINDGTQRQIAARAEKKIKDREKKMLAKLEIIFGAAVIGAMLGTVLSCWIILALKAEVL